MKKITIHDLAYEWADKKTAQNEDAYERPGNLYQVIADAGGVGWLHLPDQQTFDEMQDRRRKLDRPVTESRAACGEDCTSDSGEDSA